MSCMTIHFQNLQFTRSNIRLHIKLAVRLVIAYGHFNLPLGVYVGMYGLTYFIIPRDAGEERATEREREYIQHKFKMI